MLQLPDKLYTEIINAKNFLRNYLDDSAVSISGGKDSLVVLDLSIQVGIKKFVFGNTSLSFPGTEEYIKQLADHYHIKIDHTNPVRPFFDLIEDIGFPSQRLRWCCEVYKFGPLAKYVLRNKIKYLITGIRAEESLKRKSYSKVSRNPLIPTTQINPILSWDTESIWTYIKHYELPYHHLYDKGYDRLGCWICPFQRDEYFEKLRNYFPDLFEKLTNTLRNNMLKFGQVGIRDIDDFIKEYAWKKNAFPIRNLISGYIEYKKKKENTSFVIRPKDQSTFLALLENIQLFKNKSDKLIINNSDITIEIISNKLSINHVLFYCEKQINCIGCGACQTLCNSLAINIDNKKYKIDFSKCTSCLNCLRSNILRAGCIARNYAPIRRKFNIINLDDKYVTLEKNFMCNSENIGLIKTRKSVDDVVNRLIKFFINTLKTKPLSFKANGIQSFSTENLLMIIKKEGGFTNVNIKCHDSKVIKNLNILLNALKK